ncbi:hypothetical protein [Paenibacillus faecalis]|uniref:hypothetical protein n=1 Tax=Paenibacillus faecalis TaxID=2079532 RepID=UPI001F1982C7|nr:hypothetical protein [Paenibacillus faecalis]
MFANPEQLQEVLKKANQHARKQARESGAFIYYIKNNKRVREDAEGNKSEIVLMQPENGRNLNIMSDT